MLRIVYYLFYMKQRKNEAQIVCKSLCKCKMLFFFVFLRTWVELTGAVLGFETMTRNTIPQCGKCWGMGLEGEFDPLPQFTSQLRVKISFKCQSLCKNFKHFDI